MLKTISCVHPSHKGVFLNEISIVQSVVNISNAIQNMNSLSTCQRYTGQQLGPESIRGLFRLQIFDCFCWQCLLTLLLNSYTNNTGQKVFQSSFDLLQIFFCSSTPPAILEHLAVYWKNQKWSHDTHKVANKQETMSILGTFFYQFNCNFK